MFTLIDNFGSNDAHFNLALEEYAAKNLSNERSYCIFYVNKPCVVVGKNQNVFEEINLEVAEKEKIAIYRRISGGGAVYHDEGNINFSFLTPFDTKDIANWKKLAVPVINALNKIGFPAELNYRNDIVIGDYKISGTAQYSGKNLMISHGTLLLEANLKALSGVLTANSGSIQSKSQKSFRSKVLNLNDYAKEQRIATYSPSEFRNALIREICGEQEAFRFSNEELNKITALSKSQYQTWAWNIGSSPEFLCRKEFYVREKKCSFEMKIARGGFIEEFIFEEDCAYKELISTCSGCTLEKNMLNEQLKDADKDLRASIVEGLLRFKEKE